MKIRCLVMIAFFLWAGVVFAGNSRIYAARVDESGQPVDIPVWTEVAPSASGVQSRPRVAYYNGTFLVVWHDLRNGADLDVLGVRISSAGHILDPSPLQIGTGARTQAMPDVASDDQGFMVVWGGFQGSELFPHIFAARVGEDGVVGQASTIADGASPQIAWSSYEMKHFVMYSSAVDAYLTPSINWLRMDNAKQVASTSDSTPWLYAGGSGDQHYSVCAIPRASQGWLFVADYHTPNYWNRTTGVQRALNIVPNGTVAAESPSANTSSIEPYVVRGGDPAPANWLDVNWELEGEWPYGNSAVSPDGQYCVALWGRYHVGGMNRFSLYDSDLYASRVDRWAPVETSPVAVATSTASERNPSLAGDGSGHLVAVYEKLVDGAPQIVTRPLTVTTEISVGPELIVMGSSGQRRGFPDIAYGSGTPDVYMVVWQEGWHGLD